MSEAKRPPALLTPVVLALRGLHYAVLVFILVGWAIPNDTALIAHLILIPALAVQWRFNADSCILDNLESWLRHGRFRARDANPDEGAFLANLIYRILGIRMTTAASNAMIYGLMVLFWALSAAHLAWRW